MRIERGLTTDEFAARSAVPRATIYYGVRNANFRGAARRWVAAGCAAEGDAGDAAKVSALREGVDGPARRRQERKMIFASGRGAAW